VNDLGVTEASGTSVALAVALWLGALLPQWVLLLWGLKALPRIREVVARHFVWKLLAVAAWVGSILLAVSGTVVACRDYLGPERLGLQRIVSNATLGDQAMLIVVGLVLLARRPRSSVVPKPRLPPNPE
jgi:hypothetical protein